MNPHVLLITGSTILGLGVAFVIWSRVRVWVLRQDLFEIRDDLWDNLRATGRLDHPSHREFREGLNALIRFAPYLSLPVLVTLFLDHREELALLGRRNDDLEEVRSARVAVFFRVAIYILFQTLSGLVLCVVAIPFASADSLRSFVASRIQDLFDSLAIARIDEQISAESTQHLTAV